MSADIYPGTADAYKGPTRFAVTCPDTGDDLDYSQWIHTGAALDYHETHQQGPTSVGHGPYSNPSGLPSYQGHRNWSLPGDTWNQAINEEDCVLSSSEPAMEFSGFSDAGSYAEINDVSSTITGLIPDTRAHYQGNMSHSIDVQPVPSRTAGFVSNDMDFGSTSVHYGYKDHHRQDPHLPYQDQVQQDFQDLVPGFYPQVLYPQGQIHGRPEGATQPQDEPRTTYNVLPSRVDDMASIRANASALGSRVTASSRAYRSNTGPRLIPIPSDRAESSTRGRSSSQKASSYKELQMMPPLAPRDEGRRRDSVQTNHSSSSKYESGQRTDPLYRAYPHAVDKLYHCPFRIRGQCKHEPATLKCNYDKYIDSHLKPFRCKHTSCTDYSFSSTACLLRHEREAHGLHGHGTKPNLCPYADCDRSRPERGFPRAYNLRDHIKRVHKKSSDEVAATTVKEEKEGRGKRVSGAGGSKKRRC